MKIVGYVLYTLCILVMVHANEPPIVPAFLAGVLCMALALEIAVWWQGRRASA